MDKNLTVYPISTGNELTIFSVACVSGIRIMDMHGNTVLMNTGISGAHHIINIKELPEATYIVEVSFDERRMGRGVFVKT